MINVHTEHILTLKLLDFLSLHLIAIGEAIEILKRSHLSLCFHSGFHFESPSMAYNHLNSCAAQRNSGLEP